MQNMKEFARLADQLYREQSKVDVKLLKSFVKNVVKDPNDVSIATDQHMAQGKLNILFKEHEETGLIYAAVFKNVESGFQPVVVFCFFTTEEKPGHKKKLAENWYRTKAKALELPTIKYIRYAEHHGDWPAVVIGFVEACVYWLWFLDNSPSISADTWQALQYHKKQRENWFGIQYKRAKRHALLPSISIFLEQYWVEGTVANHIYRWLNDQSMMFFQLRFDDEVVPLLAEEWDEHTGQEVLDTLGSQEFRKLLALYADSME